MKRYLYVFKNHVILIVVLLALIIIGSLTNGAISKYTTIFAGILMIYAGIVFTLWIIRTPSRKNNDDSI